MIQKLKLLRNRVSNQRPELTILSINIICFFFYSV